MKTKRGYISNSDVLSAIEGGTYEETDLQTFHPLQQSDEQSKVRFDMRGNMILKGSKLHRVTFKRDLKEIIEIENWKIYNLVTEEDEKTCPCSLI